MRRLKRVKAKAVEAILANIFIKKRGSGAGTNPHWRACKNSHFSYTLSG